MFNNPLKKYQQSGQMSTEEAENQMAQALAEAFQMDPQVVKARIQEIRQNPEESKLFAQGLQMLQQGDQQNGMAIIGRLFQVPSRKQGGKINSFICKHAKGGKAGCGCKEDGGKVEKHTNGKPVRNGNYEVSVNAPGDTTRTIFNKWNRQIMQTYPDGSVRYTTMSNNNGDPYQANSWTGKPSLIRRLWFGSKAATPEKVGAWNEEIASQPLDPRNQKKENGGIVKGQEGINVPMQGTIAAIRKPQFAIKSQGDPRVQSSPEVVGAPDFNNPLARFSNEELAKAVMLGKFGNGAARRRALGDRYAAVQQIINRAFSKPATLTASAATPSSVATPTTTTSARASVPNNTQKVLTSSSTIEPGVITATATHSSTSPVDTVSIPDARQSIINRQVKDYIDGAGLGIGTDIIFDNGRYIWRNSGAPVEVPMVGRNGNYRPAVERNGGVVKGQKSIPGGIPEPGNVNLFSKVTPYEYPVSTQPLDSAKVKLINGNLIFTDVNGNNVVWSDLGNGDWTYRNGNDIMDFSTSQNEGFKPYGKLKAWNRATSGSTKLSEKDNNDLNNLKNRTKNRK